jgi:methylglutamate dehydrogenase subunit D
MAEAELLAVPAVLAATGGAGDAVVELARPRGMASIALFGENLLQVQEALGVALPWAGRMKTAGDMILLWSGPASWLALSNDDDPAFSAKLTGKLAGLAAVTDQGDGRAIFSVRGPAARDALAKLLPIDLHRAGFAEDATALTLAGHIGVQIWRSGEDCFELACFRSYAEALYAALREAAREFEVIDAGRG